MERLSTTPVTAATVAASTVPVGSTPEELGELAVFFCSPAAGNVRGVAWNMDGGWAAQ